MKISRNVEKLGENIPSLNLPPVVTCRSSCPCCKECYACKGRWNYKNVKIRLLNNLQDYYKDKEYFFKELYEQLSKDIIYKYFRYFASGDIVDNDFFLKMVQLSKKLKVTKFLVFTKKYEIINNYLLDGGTIPKNLIVVFSAWDKNYTFENPFNLPVAYINFKDKSKNCDFPKNIFVCGGSCKDCKTKICWNLKRGQAVLFNQH